MKLIEPSWHRNARKRRSKVRRQLRNPELLKFRQWANAVAVLAQHHGSQIPLVAMSFKSGACTSWSCSCGHHSSGGSEFCAGCGTHWQGNSLSQKPPWKQQLGRWQKEVASGGGKGKGNKGGKGTTQNLQHRGVRDRSKSRKPSRDRSKNRKI